MKKSSPYGRRVEKERARAHHTATIAKAERDFQSQLTTTRLKIMLMEPGEDATELLAALAIVIGTPCEAGARAGLRAQPWVRQLHGALRTIMSLCVSNGYAWRSECAQSLDRAAELASEQSKALPVPEFTAAWLEAQGLAMRILAHQVEEGEIA